MSILLDTSQSTYLNHKRSEAEISFRAAINPETLLGRAYKLWVNSEVNCKCPHHININYEPKPSVYNKTKLDIPVCNRQRFWRTYCAVRDGKLLTDSDKVVLGIS